MILVCYDGSPDAQAAIARAGELFPGQPATVLSVWEPFIDVMARSGLGGALAVIANTEEIDAASEKAAGERAHEGAKLANSAGLDAEAKTYARGVTTADSIIEVGDEVGADVIVLGTRGLSGLKSFVLGSVSHAVLQHADRAVLVVPSAEVASERAAKRPSR